MRTYAAFYDNVIRYSSSSGGIFSLIASQFDVVYGVSMTDDCYGVEFIRVTNNISRIRGSKYVQARMGDTFKNVKRDLENGSKVLFSGTGCQVNGLKLFLKKEYDNLFLVDVVCHGTPSPKIWKKHVLEMERKFGKLQSVFFRKKIIKPFDFSIERKKKFVFKEDDYYMRLFLSDYSLRPSCYNCPAKTQKKADITLADFWGITVVAPKINDGLGTSLIICRTKKGEHLFESIKELIEWEEVLYTDAIKYNPAEWKSPIRPIKREEFFKDVDSLSMLELKNKYIHDEKVSLLSKIKEIIRRQITKYTKWRGRSNASYGMYYIYKKK